ncbi:DUF5668 domain-containing protein [Candidatus Parcubacteria bacterium]|nr:DUF5668 domain-containing protein [Candidatus Parcubacteria bacterium]
MRLGFVVMLVGVLFLFKNVGLMSELQWDIIWPVIVLLIGISMVLRHSCRCGRFDCMHCRGDGFKKWKGTCNCDCGVCKNCVNEPNQPMR